MTAARLQTIEEIFHAALDQEPEQTSAFLDTACEGDQLLRRKVETLLASHQRAGGFIETSAVGITTRIIENGQADLLVDRTIGHYKISKRIGAGGIGEVYLATDITAGRKAALKLLPARFTGNAERLTRFQQALHSAGIAHRLIRPRSPASNGKVERLIKTIDDSDPHVVKVTLSAPNSAFLAQVNASYLGIVNNVHHRRFPLVDEERGVVWANCVFDMDGTVSQIKLNTGEVADMSSFAGRASSIHVTEVFRIENNLIRRVEMIGTSVPYHFNSTWGPVLSGK